MKKTKIVSFMLVLSLLVVGCSSPTQKVEKPMDTPPVKAEEVEVVSDEKEILKKLETISFGFLPKLTILQPDSIGTIYIEGTLVNTSDFPLLSYTLQIKDKKTNEVSYLTTYDTIMPGETSSKFNTFGPESGLTTDVEFISMSYDIKLNDIYLYVDVDLKLGEITYYEVAH